LRDSPGPAAGSSFTAGLLGQGGNGSRVGVTLTPSGSTSASLGGPVGTSPFAAKLAEGPGVNTNPLSGSSSSAVGPMLTSKWSSAAPSAYNEGNPALPSSGEIKHSGARSRPLDVNAGECPSLAGSSSTVQLVIPSTSPSANSVDTKAPSFSGIETLTSNAGTPGSRESGKQDTTPMAIAADSTAMDGSPGILRRMNPVAVTPRMNDARVHVNTYGMPVRMVVALRQEIRRIRPDVSLDDLDTAARNVANVWATLCSTV
jgi:hypothetical protein